MLIQGDARNIPLTDQSIQCCVTSPPYWGLRDYGVAGQIGLEATPDEYVATMVGVFREVRRVLRDDGTVWLNLGDSYAANRGYQVPDSKWTDVGNSKGMKADAFGLKPKDLCGIPWRVALALQADGWYLRSDIVWAKPNPMPESVTDRPTRSHEYIFLLAKSQTYFYDSAAIREESVTDDMRRPYTSSGAWEMDGRPVEQRHGGQPRSYKGSTFTKGKTGVNGLGRVSEAPRANNMGRNKRSVWTVNSEPTPEAHFATFPQKLIEPCILAGSRPGDIVLDPFLGSGTVGKVCEKYGRRWVGLELSSEYLFKIARRRTAQRGLGL